MPERRYDAQAVINEVEKSGCRQERCADEDHDSDPCRRTHIDRGYTGNGKDNHGACIFEGYESESTESAVYAGCTAFGSDGITVYRKETGKFVYQPGAVMCNLLLADEINRTSPKTQSALLEVMEEQQVTVDGVTRKTGEPFIVIATENPAGSAGTQLLPESQLDRFMICVSMGYPTVEEEMEIMRRSQAEDRTEGIVPVLDAPTLLEMIRDAREIFMHDKICRYIAELAKATRENEWTELGLSPRGTVALLPWRKPARILKNALM